MKTKIKNSTVHKFWKIRGNIWDHSEPETTDKTQGKRKRNCRNKGQTSYQQLNWTEMKVAGYKIFDLLIGHFSNIQGALAKSSNIRHRDRRTMVIYKKIEYILRTSFLKIATRIKTTSRKSTTLFPCVTIGIMRESSG